MYHMPVLIIIACLLLLTGCTQTKAISVEPIQVTVNLNLRTDGHNPEEPLDISGQVIKTVLENGFGVGTAAGDLLCGCLAFRRLHQKWPATVSDVKEALKADGGSADGLAQLEWAEFKTLDNGSLEVNYKSKGQVEGKGCIRLDWQEKDSKLQPPTGGDQIPPP